MTLMAIDAVQTADHAVLSFFREADFPGWLDTAMVWLTRAGDWGVVWIAITLVMLYLRKTRPAGVRSALALIAVTILVNLWLKPWIARPRPYEVFPDLVLLIAKESSFSFPSGHAASGFACASVFAWYYGGRSWPFVLLAALIAFSRLYLCVHFLTDVLAGALLGILLGTLFYMFVHRSNAR